MFTTHPTFADSVASSEDDRPDSTWWRVFSIEEMLPWWIASYRVSDLDHGERSTRTVAIAFDQDLIDLARSSRRGTLFFIGRMLPTDANGWILHAVSELRLLRQEEPRLVHRFKTGAAYLDSFGNAAQANEAQSELLVRFAT